MILFKIEIDAEIFITITKKLFVQYVFLNQTTFIKKIFFNSFNFL